MEQQYKIIKLPSPDIENLKGELIEQKNSLEKKIKKLEDRETKHKLEETLMRVREASESLIPLQESISLAWKRLEQVEEEILHLIEKHS